MSDDILDNLSLSDDEMLDNLANDMLLEMEEEKAPQLEGMSTPAVPESWARCAVSNAAAPPPVLPDLSQVMSQMMPMMSQMFGGNSNITPMVGNRMPQAPVTWQELVKRHVPSNEQEDWLTTIDKDAKKLRLARMSTILTNPHSRSYRATSSVMPGSYMNVNTMLANMLTEAVRSAHLEHNRQWQDLSHRLVSRLTQTGMAKVFEHKFQLMLRQRIANDPDYLEEKDRERYCNIARVFAL